MNQHTLWNSTAAQGWIAARSMLDQTYKPLEDMLTEAVCATSATRVLDVGCGTGATTIAVARRLGAGSNCLGVDISEAMVAAARAQAERKGVAASFLCADAQTYPFAAASFDMVISRFGVMFFDDPVRAFANLRNATSQGAALCCIAWRGPEENAFMTAAERVAELFLAGVSKRVLNEPGQFGLADRTRVLEILRESGWQDIDIAPLDTACAFPRSALELYMHRMGPVGRALQGADDSTRIQVIEAVRPAFEPYLHGSEVRFTACCWLLRARAGA